MLSNKMPMWVVGGMAGLLFSTLGIPFRYAIVFGGGDLYGHSLLNWIFLVPITNLYEMFVYGTKDRFHPAHEMIILALLYFIIGSFVGWIVFRVIKK